MANAQELNDNMMEKVDGGVTIPGRTKDEQIAWMKKYYEKPLA